MSLSAPYLSRDTIGRMVLRDGGMSVALLSHGAVTQDWRVPFKGDTVPVILGYDDPERYRHAPDYVGAIVGRVANRIGRASYAQAGRQIQLDANDGPHQLHGGPGGLSTVAWELEQLDEATARLSHNSPDGANGFPGAVSFEITISLRAPRLRYEMVARPDCETPISLAQHNYYNLMGHGTIAGHRLNIPADRVLERDDQGIMTGGISPVKASRFDFRAGRDLDARETYDDFVVFAPGATPCADLNAPNGLRMRMWSDQPGAQVYTGHGMQPHGRGLDGRQHAPFSGLCIEPSGYPNALNCPNFPSILCAPDQPYRQTLTVEVTG